MKRRKKRRQNAAPPANREGASGVLTILPMEDREREKSLLDGLSEKTEDNARVLMMSDGKEELGWVAVEIIHSVLRMLHMEVPGAQPETLTGESVFIADSLMRAAASY